MERAEGEKLRPPGATLILIVITNVLAGEKTIDSLQLRTIDSSVG